MNDNQPMNFLNLRCMTTTPTPPDSLLSKKEAAQLLKISLRTLDTWMAQRLIPFFKIGDAKNAIVRFKREDILQALSRFKVYAEGYAT